MKDLRWKTVWALLSVPVLVMLLVGQVEAESITFNYEGVITGFTDPSNRFGGSILVGKTFSGSYTFDSTVPPFFQSTTFAKYFINAPNKMTLMVQAGPFMFKTPPNSTTTSIDVANNNEVNGGLLQDEYVVGTPLSQLSGPALGFDSASLSITLRSLTNLSAIQSTNLPLMPPDISLFSGNRVLFRMESNGAFLGAFTGPLTSLTLANQPPDCSGAYPSIAEIWPPNHKMTPVNIMGVNDPDGDPVTIAVTKITQDEPVNGSGDGDTAPDGAGIGASTALVRAERSGTQKAPGNGRVYVISFAASDGKGGTCNASVKVCVPHDMRPGHACIDDGQNYYSTGAATKPVASAGPAPEAELMFSVENYPNPFNPSTTIRYMLTEASNVRLTIYNVLGQQVRALVNAAQAPGVHRAQWDGRDASGRKVASGIYIYRLEAGPRVAVRNMIFAK